MSARYHSPILIGIAFCCAIGLTKKYSMAECPYYSYQDTLTWGGAECDRALALAVGQDGSVMLTGTYEGQVDFDPGAGVDMHSAKGAFDIFTTRFNSYDVYDWTATVGSVLGDATITVAMEGDYVYVGGNFNWNIDLDPTEGMDKFSPVGGADAFLTQLTSSGEYGWSVTYGSIYGEEIRAVGLDAIGDVYIVGYFNETIDFDPSEDGVDERTPLGTVDAFLTKLDSFGNYQWTVTLGAESDDWGWDVAVDETGVYIAGEFSSIVDFDAGVGIDMHTSNGQRDAFVSKFTQDGIYLWTWTAGGPNIDAGYALALCADGGPVVTGLFGEATIDFDPSDGIDEHTSNGGFDIFATKISSAGSYDWTYTIGGTDGDIAYCVSADGDGLAYIGGVFGDSDSELGYTVDFNPPAGDLHVSNGAQDMFVTALSCDGEYGWTYAAGGPNVDVVWSVAAAPDGRVMFTGGFRDTVDFNPATGEDIHSSSASNTDDIFLTTLICSDLPPPCDGDVNADAVVDPLDSGYVLARFNCPVGGGDPLCDAADANLDGLVDPLDVGYVLSRFGGCE